MATTTITVALDWTPNTNHIGFYVARAKGLYDAVGINVELVSPASDSYDKTPRKRVEEGLADLGVCPSETVISCNTCEKDVADGQQVLAIAALLQTQTSAIVTLKGGEVSRPKELDGRKYASYQGRFEMDIVQELVRADGGKGEVKEVLPGEHGLGIWKTILERKGVFFGCDTVWVHAGADRESGCSESQASSPEEASQILVTSSAHVGVTLTPDMVKLSAQRLQSAFLHPSGRWGLMDGARWKEFVGWLEEKGIVKDREGKKVGVKPYTELFTNDYLSP